MDEVDSKGLHQSADSHFSHGISFYIFRCSAMNCVTCLVLATVNIFDAR